MYLVVLLAVLAMVAAEDTYGTAYDNIDIDAILANKRLLGAYVKCLMGRGKCTPAGEAIKRILAEAVETDCEKCNAKQKEHIQKVWKFLFDNHKDLYKELAAKYDPKNKHYGEFKTKP